MSDWTDEDDRKSGRYKVRLYERLMAEPGFVETLPESPLEFDIGGLNPDTEYHVEIAVDKAKVKRKRKPKAEPFTFATKPKKKTVKRKPKRG